jgi:hypothetical protein
VGIALESFSDTSAKDINGVGEVVVFVNLGFTHLSSQVSQGTLASNELWRLDEVTGQIKTDYSLDLNNFDLLNVRAITSASGAWKIGESGSLVVKSVRAERGEFDEMIVNNGVTVKDSDTGEYQCLYVASGSVKTKPGPCSAPSTPPTPVVPPSETASDTPPVVEDSPVKEPDPIEPSSPIIVPDLSSPVIAPPTEPSTS